MAQAQLRGINLINKVRYAPALASSLRSAHLHCSVNIAGPASSSQQAGTAMCRRDYASQAVRRAMLLILNQSCSNAGV